MGNCWDNHSNIDNLIAKGVNLNEIENLNFDEIIIDSVDIKPKRLEEGIKKVLVMYK